MGQTIKHSKVTSAQDKAGKPAAKSSQGGYGHTSGPGGTTTPQGSGRNKPGQKPT